MLSLSKKDFEFLQELMEQYDAEASKCKRARAHLAGCAMLAAKMEASLLSLAYCCEEEVHATATYRQASDKDLRTWSLRTLLELASELRWLPSQIPLKTIARLSGVDPDEALKQGDVVYFADAVREVRDMVHPGRYVRLWSGVKVDKSYPDSVEETVQIVVDYLYTKLISLISSSKEFKDWQKKSRS